MARDIKIRYTVIAGSNQKLHQRFFTINEIETGFLSDWLNSFDVYTIIARDEFLGLVDRNGKSIFVGDRLKIENDEANFRTGFENSKAGKFMNEYNIDYLLIEIQETGTLSVKYDIYFVKDGKLLTELDYYSHGEDISDKPAEDLESYNKPYFQTGDTMTFLRYLENKNIVNVVSNIHIQPDLLA